MHELKCSIIHSLEEQLGALGTSLIVAMAHNECFTEKDGLYLVNLMHYELVRVW